MSNKSFQCTGVLSNKKAQCVKEAKETERLSDPYHDTHSKLEHQEGDWEVLPVTDPQILPPTNYLPLRSNSFLYILISNGKWQCFTTYI